LNSIEIQEGKKLRIEIDEQLEKMLDKIKRERWIRGKGHTETVRYLAQHHEEFESIRELIDQKFRNMERILEKGILAAAKSILNNILKPSD